MSCLGKRKEEEEDQDQDLASEALASSHVHHAQGPPKKTLKKEDSADDSNDDVVVCEISKNRRVSVRHWQGKIFIDIREYYLKDGKQMPGKKVPALFWPCPCVEQSVLLDSPTPSLNP
ncbi:hypothetical protein F8388_011283 [Cannabis sativa]|uniref:Transcriptional coactivator p15 (PC4) C-terminal domain-containing protein n=1 Tax=Cannabis sativa TaxID=3483 RepID=A0A7J6EQH7_CANSA|nr:hypothetical protein F8388_011283 [Cannabis sativa]